SACFRLGPDPRRALGPAAKSAAQTGRTRDRTRPMLQQRQKVLAKAPSTRDPKRTLNARSTVANCGPRATWQLHSQRLAVVRPSHLALLDHLRRDRNHALARPPQAHIALGIARAKLDGLQGLALRAERGTSVFRLSCPARGRCRVHEGQAPRRDALAGTCADNAVGRRQRCYGRSLSISALSAASIVRYDAS